MSGSPGLTRSEEDYLDNLDRHKLAIRIARDGLQEARAKGFLGADKCLQMIDAAIKKPPMEGDFVDKFWRRIFGKHWP